MRSTTPGKADETTCAALSQALTEPLPGTAAVATAWLCLEQPGPWGHNALRESHLDPELGRELDERAAAHGVRVQLIRRPGRHADTGGPRQALLAHTAPGGWLRGTTVTDPADLLKLDFARIAAGEHDDWGTPVGPRLLVCTNGRRDRCCAVLGRELVNALGDGHATAVWETSHTGGHRFAPAAVLLPSGHTYGRLTARQAESVLAGAATEQIPLDGLRGRSTWSKAGQAAELAVRQAIGETAIDALTVLGEGTEVHVRHRDGRRWRVTVASRELDPPRPNSCGKRPARPEALDARIIDQD